MNRIPRDFQSATYYAEGWLSQTGGGRFQAGMVAARFLGFPIWQRPIIALRIAIDLKRRGLKPGFDIKDLDG